MAKRASSWAPWGRIPRTDGRWTGFKIRADERYWGVMTRLATMDPRAKSRVIQNIRNLCEAKMDKRSSKDSSPSCPAGLSGLDPHRSFSFRLISSMIYSS
jgi:hypothetical protein